MSGRTPFSLFTRRQFAGAGAMAGLMAAVPAAARHHDRGSAGYSGGSIGFRRGINIYHMMREPKRLPNGQFPWPPYEDSLHQMSDLEISKLRSVGFDFVRLAITPDIFTITQGDQGEQLYGILKSQIQRFLRAGLQVLVDLHPVANDNPGYTSTELVADIDGDSFKRYTNTVTQFARHLRDAPRGQVAFELMNEPELSYTRWQPMLERLHDAARQQAPDLLIFLTGSQQRYDTLMRLNTAPFSGSNVVYSFHYYEPHEFTHQGAGGDRTYVVGVPWPTSGASQDATITRINAYIDHNAKLPDDQKTITKAKADSVINQYFARGWGPNDIATHFGEVAQWADSNGIPRERIVVSEFGVARTLGRWVGAAEADRQRWLQAVSRAAEGRRFGWALWAYSGPAGMTLANEYPARTLDNATLTAIGLQPATTAGQ
jgi:aryl-phospho-beta-D-glucosidase BglC (GH1 family)